jgi:hypothetical protein
MWKRIILSLALAAIPLLGQDLFDKAVEENSSAGLTGPGLSFELNGFVRGGVFLGTRPVLPGIDIKHSAAEAAFRLRVRNEKLGDAFAEFRISKGFSSNRQPLHLDLREAYINIYLENIDLRIGEQIVVWGRADGINPTNTITPRDLLIFSPDEDDRRKGNFILRSFWNLPGMRLEALWIPVYRPSVLPLAQAKLPEGVTVSEGDYPNQDLRHSGFAIKLHFENPSFDGSLSYFNGYALMPGIRASRSGPGIRRIIPTAYRVQILGADFSTTAGRTGLRGEFAVSLPENTECCWESIPRPQIEGVFGLEREWGEFGLILQYVGKHVAGFYDLGSGLPGNTEEMGAEVRLWNRMLFSQLKEWTHSLFLRPSLSLLHGSLVLEVQGLENFSTKEIFLKPKVVYRPTDSLILSAGFQLYSGPQNTLFGKIGRKTSAVFLEVKTSY